MSTRLRLATPDDAAEIARIYAPWVRNTTISFELEPPDAAEMAARIEATLRFFPYLVIERQGELLAYAYASRLRGRPAYDWVTETSVYVAEHVVSHGHGRRVYQALLDLLALQGHWWAYGGVALPNEGSQRFHASLGFERFGCFPAVGFKFGRWCDVEWWRRRLAPPDAPEPPTPVLPIHHASLTAVVADRLARG